jgi:trimeric autotransporter adhesin
MKHTVPLLQTSIGRPQNSLGFALVLLALIPVLLGIASTTQAVSPLPDGGYPGGNTAEGQAALFSLTTGVYNTAVGVFSLKSDATGSFNTAIGAGALLFSTGDENTATGAGALLSNTVGENNTANGEFTLSYNIDGSNNTATGAFALFDNTTGNKNTATGADALHNNTEGSENTAIGFEALSNETTGAANTAAGTDSLFSNTGGQFNTGVGDEALYNNTDGDNNTGMGTAALSVNTTGFSNTAIGHDALGNNSTGSGNVGVGENAGFNVSTASNVICIGSIGGANIDNSCFIGNIYSNIQPVIGTDPDYVTIASDGRLGRSNLNGSSRRFKHDIQPMNTASEVIFTLKPVRFRYNKEYDATQRLSFGLIAEEVAEVDSELVGRNQKGEPESVRYEQINAMLLNEFLKEHRKVKTQTREIQEQQAAISKLKKEMASVVARFKDQDSKIEKMSAQMQISKRGRQIARNNP